MSITFTIDQLYPARPVRNERSPIAHPRVARSVSPPRETVLSQAGASARRQHALEVYQVRENQRQRLSLPAALTSAMIDQMGGSPTSAFRGSVVDVNV